MAHRTQAALMRASAHAAKLAWALGEALAGSADDTRTPARVVDIIDQTLRELHQVRARPWASLAVAITPQCSDPNGC